MAEFNGGTITSDGGVLLLKEVEAKRKIIKQFAECFSDYRDPSKIEHTAKDRTALSSADADLRQLFSES